MKLSLMISKRVSNTSVCTADGRMDELEQNVNGGNPVSNPVSNLEPVVSVEGVRNWVW